MVTHAVQPLAPTWQRWALPLAHWVAPAVQVLLQAWHCPLVQALMVGQLVVVHVVQPLAASSVQVCFWPEAVHTAAPWVQALMQQVAALEAIWLSAALRPAESFTAYEVPVPPAEATASSTARSLAPATDAPKPTT